MTRKSKHVARMVATGAALAPVTAAGVAEGTAVEASFTVLAHLPWLWIPAAVGLESAAQRMGLRLQPASSGRVRPALSLSWRP